MQILLKHFAFTEIKLSKFLKKLNFMLKAKCYMLLLILYLLPKNVCLFSTKEKLFNISCPFSRATHEKAFPFLLKLHAKTFQLIKEYFSNSCCLFIRQELKKVFFLTSWVYGRSGTYAFYR